ncbi:hypothetical protein [Prevotella sp. OH937_COT-195]|uniref:hypothetical protein n=1 Tax=Prevotella sp. OH937_COT-195 TaxID=2491051 RepID=UPI000F64E9F3|nr:hypothetical protein [Prevotella sp. OH937_COT-195]RRD02328.1 hypothetical protein EII32_03690 [Prevotella sp. OH937_COT-195]
MPLPLRFPTALTRLLTSAQPFHLDVTRYALDETAAHPLNNRTKPVEGSNDRLGFNMQCIAPRKLCHKYVVGIDNIQHVAQKAVNQHINN